MGIANLMLTKDAINLLYKGRIRFGLAWPPQPEAGGRAPVGKVTGREATLFSILSLMVRLIIGYLSCENIIADKSGI